MSEQEKKTPIPERDIPPAAEADTKMEGNQQSSFLLQSRLPSFSGDGKDADFDLWKFGVDCLVQEGLGENTVRAFIRKSLKGQASRTLLSLGVEASVQDILAKFTKQ